ncbi:MAG TPA: sugar transferase [Anaerolineales bacterium]|jgi:exopolysaccharide biosynthesis polyprenyl glycosylphosphotransferase|nr:sugar transferase [Anaerolineales bacterium]HQX15250.1 sugar transferase [Anaerolineales bacterium]
MAENLRTTPLRLRPSEHRALLFFGDLVLSMISVFAALSIWRAYNYNVQYQALLAEKPPIPEPRIIAILNTRVDIEVPFWFYLLPILWMLLLVDLYEPSIAGSGRKTTRGIAIAAFIALALYSFIFVFTQDPTNLPRVGVGAYLIFASLLTLAWRMIFIRIYKRTGQLRRMLIIGAGQAGKTLAQLYETLGTRSFNLVGFVDDDNQKVRKSFHGSKVLGSSERLLALIDEHQVTDLVVAINGEIQGKTFQSILDAQEKGVEVMRMPILYEEMTGRLPIHHLESDWIIRSFVDEVRVSGMYELTKRILDVAGGLVGIMVLLVLFPFVAFAIVLDSGFPITYKQTRLGKGARRFTIYKFRSMRQDAEQQGEAKLAEKDDPRVTRVGDFLRKTRLDEFPQFWNVLRGDMSLVGPRAERPELVAAFQKQVPFYRARLLVKPGVSGWAQINYGYYASVTEMAVKLEYDLYYIKHRSLTMDFQIILRTIGTMLRRTGR